MKKKTKTGKLYLVTCKRWTKGKKNAQQQISIAQQKIREAWTGTKVAFASKSMECCDWNWFSPFSVSISFSLLLWTASCRRFPPTQSHPRASPDLPCSLFVSHTKYAESYRVNCEWRRQIRNKKREKYNFIAKVELVIMWMLMWKAELAMLSKMEISFGN